MYLRSNILLTRSGLSTPASAATLLKQSHASTLFRPDVRANTKTLSFSTAVNLSLCCYDKITTSPELFKHKFSELRSEIPNHLEIYTDGSKDGHRTAAAVAAPNTVKTVRLPNNLYCGNPCTRYGIRLRLLHLGVARGAFFDCLFRGLPCCCMVDETPARRVLSPLVFITRPFIITRAVSAVRQRYFRIDTLKEFFEIVDSRNIIAFIAFIIAYNIYFILAK